MHADSPLPSIARALEQIETGELRARDLAERCLERIAVRDTEVQAFVAHDAGRVRAQADAIDAGERRGLLRGIPYAVKDVIETAAYPTGYGSALYTGNRTARDAACVALSQEQGAVLLGKVATSEFATQTPGPTRNPLNLAHTPGGSSSGSAAAVADGMAMVAWGTQTTGSITRPAVYCGVVGYKPSFGLVSTAGVGVLSPSQDTVGALARSVADAAALVLGIHGRRYESAPDDARYTVGVCLSSQWRHAGGQAIDALRSWTAKLAAAGMGVKEFALPPAYEALIADQSRLVAYDARQALAYERLTANAGISPRLRERLAAGGVIGLDEYLAMQQRASALRCLVDGLFDGVDALAYPAAEDEAEEGILQSGSPRFGALWTLLHVPTVALPLDVGRRGLPLGAQLVGRPNRDLALLQLAEHASAFSPWLMGSAAA